MSYKPSELFVELRSEEIPARMQVRAGEDLKKAMTKGLQDAGLSVEDVTVFTGPRRLVFAARVPARSPDVSEERKGPRVGSPEQALAGFMKAAGLTDISQAQVREDKKGQHYVAVIERAGRDTAEIAAELIPAVMRDFPWPKSMKSGASDFRWVRPLRGIVALLDGEVIPMEVGGIASGNQTVGHRQHGPGPFEVSGLASYLEVMADPGHVIPDHAVRKASIEEQIWNTLPPSSGYECVADEGLLNEVTGLVEWPEVFVGEMDPAFLDLPEEVIRLTLKSHQKTFTVRDTKTGKLAPKFVIVANIEPADEGDTLKAGNAKVIAARLSDAAFFIETDAKTTLAEHAKGLERVVFHDKLGSFADKVERVAALARNIAKVIGADVDKAEQAARLSKADLVTGTVIEMTSLQGQIGRMMAEREGLDPDIARAIEEHYKPQGPSDTVPTAPVSVAVALADKLDSLVAFWAIDEKPTGSKDPYALRRAALGVVRLVIENDLELNVFIQLMIASGLITSRLHPDYEQVSDAFAHEIKQVKDGRKSSGNADFQNAKAAFAKAGEEKTAMAQTDDLFAFILDRLKGLLRDAGHRHDIIDAVMQIREDDDQAYTDMEQLGDLVSAVRRVEALGGLLGTEDGENLVAGYKRAANILRAERKKGELNLPILSLPGLTGQSSSGSRDSVGDPPVKPGDDMVGENDFTATQAASLFNALTTARPVIDAALSANDYPRALEALAALRAPVDAFFEGVMVNSDDADERVRRLSLLDAMVETAHRIADFSKLDG